MSFYLLQSVYTPYRRRAAWHALTSTYNISIKSPLVYSGVRDMSEQEQDLTPAMQEMMAQMARMQAELDSLKARIYTQPQPTIQTIAF